MKDNWIENLKKEFSYCNYIEMIPFPSITPEFCTGFLLECGLDHSPIDEDKCKICTKNSPCSCFEITEEIRGWINAETPIKETVTRCKGTKERDICSCDGNKLHCNFYK